VWTPSTPLNDLIGVVAASPCGVPVVDAEHRYVGVVSKAALLETLDREASACHRDRTAESPGPRRRRRPRGRPWDNPWGAPDGGRGGDWLGGAAPDGPGCFDLLDPFREA
jgi:hypothetical protein